MIFIVHSETNQATIESNLGASEYSYYFVLKEFLPVLSRLGTVKEVRKPVTEVDVIFADAKKHGEECVFLSFAPPNRTALELTCPTIPVFAWEFDEIPNETWFGECEQDWRLGLNTFGRAITHSTFAVDAIRRAMGAGFPAMSIPAPVWDRYSNGRMPGSARAVGRRVRIKAPDGFIDTRTFDWKKTGSNASMFSSQSAEVELSGVVYTSVLNPRDGRKNLGFILKTFLWAFREIEDATLVLKLVSRKPRIQIDSILRQIHRQLPFKCRIVLIAAYLDDEEYAKLFQATSFALNASIGEGQCLPLMEYMSGGKPAISPRHSAMTDYVSEQNSFVVRSSPRITSWPADPRHVLRTRAQQIDTGSLVEAFSGSYRVAKEDPARYAAMSDSASEALRKYCSSAVVEARLAEFLKIPAAPKKTDHGFGRIQPRNIDYRTGRLLDFNGDVDARRYLHAGWSEFEYGVGFWSDGEAAELAFNIPKSAGPLKLTTKVTAYINSINGSMSVNVSVNGTRAGQWKFSRSGVFEWEHSLRTADLPPHPGGEMRLRFDIKYPASPSRLGLSSDERMLGIALEELVIEERR